MKKLCLFATAFSLNTEAVARAEQPREPVTSWAATTESPVAVAPARLAPRDGALLARCGSGEAGLSEVARRVVTRKLAGMGGLDREGLSFAQRAAGEPHVWPSSWVVSGKGLDAGVSLRELDAWLATSPRTLGVRRCGISSTVGTDGVEAIGLVAVDALADLEPLPTRVHVGQWLTVDARMLAEASAARVVVLGPNGAPRTIPSSFAHGRIRGRFAPEQPGSFKVQVVADVASGPRPVLEASVFADVEPPATMLAQPAPGESDAAGAQDAEDALLRMTDAVRRDEGRRPLLRDTRLDALARAHARRMKETRSLGHDAGDGDPVTRLENAGLVARACGENVAQAPTVTHAHRSLYGSPSHRANLLREDFDRVGVAAIGDDEGGVWVVELFASGL